MRVLVTRAIEDAERTALNLKARGHEPVIAPLRACLPLPTALPHGDFDAVLATSRHAFAGEPLPLPLRDLPCFCVGARTAEAALKTGFSRAQALGGNGAALAQALAKQLPAPSRLLYLAGNPRHHALEAGLKASGFGVTALERYAMARVGNLPEIARDALAQGTLDAALHYSAKSASAFLALVAAAGQTEAAAKILHLCLSDAIAAVFPPGFRHRSAGIAEEDALLALLGSA